MRSRPALTRIGIATGYDPALDVRAFARTVGEVDERGYEIAFFSETIALMRDSVTAMAAFALASRRVALGCTQVVRLRSPVTMAQTLAPLDELSGGRMVLCPGAATALHAQRFGFPPSDPPTALTEWVEAIRLVLTGERVSYKGTTVAFDDVELGWTPLRRRIPLWIAATSATGLRLAGRIGDGVLLNTVASPEYSANAVRIVRQAVEEAGRDWASFEVAQLINTSVEDDHAAALDAVRWEVATKFSRQVPEPGRPRACVSGSRGSTRPSCRASRRPSPRADPRVSPAPSPRRGSRASRPAARPTRSGGASTATARPG